MMPELIHIGPLTVHTYGFMWVVGIWLAVFRALRVAPRYGIRSDDVLDLAVLMVAVGIVGGRATYVLTYWSLYSKDLWSIFRVWEGGMSYFGGFGLATLAGIWLVHRRRLPLWSVADLSAPSVALGYAIARIGCFGAGCCYGAPTSLPWGVQFPDTPSPVHPTQLYATVMNLGIFLLLRWRESAPRAPGQLFALFLSLHGLYRFLNEFFRAGATSKIIVGMLTYGHLVAFGMTIIGIALYYRLRKEQFEKSLPS